MAQIDLDEAINELGLQAMELPEFLEDLRSYCGERIPLIKEMIEKGQSKLLYEEAHALKGALRNLRFQEAGNLAYALEGLGKSQSLEGAKELLGQLEKSLAQSFALADEWCLEKIGVRWLTQKLHK